MSTPFPILIRKAAAKLEQFDFSAAESLYRQALEQRPGNAAAALGMAIVCNRTGRAAQALELLSPMADKLEATDADPSSKAATRVQLGQAYLALGQPQAGLEQFQRAHRLFPTAELEPLIERLSAALAARGRESPEKTRLARAAHARRHRQWSDAEAIYRAILHANPNHPEALHGLGLLMRETGRAEEALGLIQQAILLEPERADLLNDLGMVFQDRGQLEKAIGFHQRALRIRPDFALALNNLGVACKRAGRLEEAEQAYRRAIELHPRFAQPYNNLGNLMLLRGRPEEAERCLRRALELFPDYLEARETLAALSRAGGHGDHSGLREVRHG